MEEPQGRRGKGGWVREVSQTAREVFERALGQRFCAATPLAVPVLSGLGVACTLSYTYAKEKPSDWGNKLPFISESGARMPMYAVFVALPGSGAVLFVLACLLVADAQFTELEHDHSNQLASHNLCCSCFAPPHAIVTMLVTSVLGVLSLLLTVILSVDIYTLAHSLFSYAFFASLLITIILNLSFHNLRNRVHAFAFDEWERPWVRVKRFLVAWPFVLIGVAAVCFATLSAHNYWQRYTVLHQLALVIGLLVAAASVRHDIIRGQQLRRCGADKGATEA